MEISYLQMILIADFGKESNVYLTNKSSNEVLDAVDKLSKGG